MADQIYIGNFSHGQTSNRTAFNIDNSAFPNLFNFYVWRGRAKRKRGTIFLAHLQRQISIEPNPVDFGTTPWVFKAPNLIGGAINLITQMWTTNTTTTYQIESTSTITPGSISFVVGANTYTEPSVSIPNPTTGSTVPDGSLIGTPAGSGTINYATGDVTITGGGVSEISGSFSYYPNLPVMGLRDFNATATTENFPLLLSFDTTYSYQINQNSSNVFFYTTNYYKNSENPFIWSGKDFQQFWTTNYSGALWATNNVPGFHFETLTNTLVGSVSVKQVSATQVKIAFPIVTELVVGDYLFFNEVIGTIGTGSGTIQNQNINGMTGVITSFSGGGNAFVDFTGTNGTTLANFQAGASGTDGIVQFLTNSLAGQDGIKWYDGDPTGGTGIPAATGLGWVNFAPPLTGQQPPGGVSINNLTSRIYYLVGALAIVPFKDRLLFISPWIQASSGGPTQLLDTILWSQNGTPYYTALTPFNETFTFNAYFVDQTGLGGFLPAGISQPIKTVTPNEDVLLVGFGGNGRKTRFVYTGNDLQPFLFFTINSELPSQSTFSSISLDRGAIDLGQYGIAMTDQQSSQRIDLEIPDNVFDIQALNNGFDRINAIRDFRNEWIYFSYPLNDSKWKFPTQTFYFNYRDNTWAIFYENWTTHGRYRPQQKNTWRTIGQKFKTWSQWREAWNSGATSALYANIIAGNPQGFVLFEGEGTGEGISGLVSNIQDDGIGNTQITSINHCVAVGDYLSFSGDIIGLVTNIIDVSNFVIDIPFPSISNITNATNSNPCTLTIEFPVATDGSNINSYFIGQQISISGIALGSMTELNGNTYTITSATPTTLTLNVDSTGFTPYVDGSGGITTLTASYLGLSNFIRLSQPLLQTKQFPFYWEQGRQVRLGVQKYLLESTTDGQITVNIYLSQDATDAWNAGTIVPDENTENPSLVYSQLIYTCPESSNIGLTSANTNLQMPVANILTSNVNQIWHRYNTSLIGDSIQIGITLNDAQMRDFHLCTSEIILHGIHLTVQPGPHLA